jgi:hypothetical protein
MRLAITMITAGLVLTGCDNPNRFDLKCQQTVTLFGKEIQTSGEFRVDLKTRYWCADECDETTPLAGLTASEIKLLDDPKATITISRESGDYRGMSRDAEPGDATTGHCVKTPFKGFPKTKF